MAPELETTKAQLEELLYAMFREKEAPLICDLHRLATGAGLLDLAEALYPWTEGSYRNIFSQPTDVDLASDYIVFDISEMDDEMRPVAMQVVLSWLWRNIFADPRPRLIYVDEAWCLLKSAGDWFAAAYKRARKHWAGFSINDHEVETLLNSDVMKTILTNSATKLLFSQEPSAVPALAKAFDLTDLEQQAILSGSPGEALFYAENSHVRLRVITPPEWESLLSTSPSFLYARRAANA
jgi:type IV secretory pathway VirB4 component